MLREGIIHLRCCISFGLVMQRTFAIIKPDAQPGPAAVKDTSADHHAETLPPPLQLLLGSSLTAHFQDFRIGDGRPAGYERMHTRHILGMLHGLLCLFADTPNTPDVVVSFLILKIRNIIIFIIKPQN